MSEAPYSRLEAHRAAVELARAIFPVVRGWDWFERSTIGIQLVRATESVGANIAESTGRTHAADKLRFLHIARGSLYEAEHWIERARYEGLLLGEVDALVTRAGRMLAGLIRFREHDAAPTGSPVAKNGATVAKPDS